jgi:hypothetical protein
MLHSEAIDPATFAASVRELLSEDVRRYRNFGMWWFFVKALLRRFYDKHNLAFLGGTYEDETVNERIPPGMDAYEMMAAATEEYIQNASFNLGSNEVTDADGQFFTILDPDVEG